MDLENENIIEIFEMAPKYHTCQKDEWPIKHHIYKNRVAVRPLAVRPLAVRPLALIPPPQVNPLRRCRFGFNLLKVQFGKGEGSMVK